MRPPSSTNSKTSSTELEHSTESSSSSSTTDALVPEEYVCPLTLTVMNDPVVSKFGHSYERDAILKWLVSHQSCPMTRQPLKLSDLITNHQLRARIRRWQVEFEQDITVVCATLDFQNNDDGDHIASGYYFLPDLDETERSDEDDDDAGVVAGPTAGPRPPRGVVARRHAQWLAHQRRRRMRQSTTTTGEESPTTTTSPGTGTASSNGGGNGLNSLSRRIFGRPATAA